MRSELLVSWGSTSMDMHADDLQIYDHCLASDTPQLTNRLNHCIEIVDRWMSSKDPSLSFDSFRKLLKTFLFDKWLLHERICGSCINLRGEMFIIIIIITAWGWIHRRRNSSGWVQHVVWQNAPSIQSASAGKLYNHRKRFAISERILIRPLVSPSTSPGCVTSTSANSGRSVGRSPSNPSTPWWGRWSWHASTTVTDFLAEHRSVSSARYLASYGLPHDWFCCSLEQAV